MQSRGPARTGRRAGRGGRQASLHNVVQRGVADDCLVSVCRRLRRQFDARSTVLDAVLAVLYDVPDAEFEQILRPPWYDASGTKKKLGPSS